MDIPGADSMNAQAANHGLLATTRYLPRLRLERSEMTASSPSAMELGAERWRQFAASDGAELGGGKLRFGRPYQPRASLTELCQAGPCDHERRMLILEHQLASSHGRAPEPDDWVARQLELCALLAKVEG